jgi:hypothetical protein
LGQRLCTLPFGGPWTGVPVSVLCRSLHRHGGWLWTEKSCNQKPLHSEKDLLNERGAYLHYGPLAGFSHFLWSEGLQTFGGRGDFECPPGLLFGRCFGCGLLGLVRSNTFELLGATRVGMEDQTLPRWICLAEVGKKRWLGRLLRCLVQCRLHIYIIWNNIRC